MMQSYASWKFKHTILTGMLQPHWISLKVVCIDEDRPSHKEMLSWVPL